jgi:hypothetical protein
MAGKRGILSSSLRFAIDHSKQFSEISLGLVAIAATLIGGIWTVWVFYYQVADARARRSPSIEASVSASQEILQESGQFIRAVVKLKNVGNQETEISLLDKPLVVARVKSFDDGSPQFDAPQLFLLARPPAHDREAYAMWIRVRPQETRNLEFFVKVPAKGLYVVMFSAALSATEFDRLVREGRIPASGDDKPPRWETFTFLEVK